MTYGQLLYAADELAQRHQRGQVFQLSLPLGKPRQGGGLNRLVLTAGKVLRVDRGQGYVRPQGRISFQVGGGSVIDFF